ncbi:kinase-like domain-containing protein [Hyaloraphidium curvatum]|nr:kinase-like domain-containing protein [Hyaloraphidium curvatum]
MWSGSPAPSDSGQGGDVKRQPSLSRPPSSSNVSVSGSEKEREKPATLKRVGSEQYLAQKYGEVDGKVIGRGATSVVRLAHKKELPPGSTIANGDKGLDITYAIKEFRKRRRDESERDYVKKLSTEFCIGHSLHHPNVVDHIELLQTQQGAWCEVLEYCSGGDLCNLIQHGGLTYDEANGFFAQLVNGVAYLHTLGVAHKDLKPENLMLDGKGSLKITDFGSAEVFRSVWEKEAHKSHRLAGSEPYIAPEEFTEKEFDPRAVDVWACGIIYLTMIYNRIPWRSATGADPNYKFYLRCRANSGAAEATAFPMLDHLPSGPRNLVFRMLDPNPDTRIAIEDVRRDAWFRNVVKSHIHDQWMERSDSETEKAMTAKKAQDSDGKPERAQKATSERAPSTTAGPHGPSKLGACVVPEGVGAAAGGAQGATSK